MQRKFTYLTLIILFFVGCKTDEPDLSNSVECPQITSFNVKHTKGQLTLDWESTGVASGYEVVYDQSGISPNLDPDYFTDSYKTGNVKTLSKSYRELNMFKDVGYTFAIRAICGENYGPWSSMKNITVYVCETPSNIRFEKSIAELVWSSEGNPAYFEVEYGLQGFKLGEGTIIKTNEANTVEMKMTKGNVYEIYVRQYCNANLGWSDWSKPVTFLADTNYGG